MDAPTKVLFLVRDTEEVSVRFRVLQYLPHLRMRGIAATVADLHVPPRERRRLIRQAADYDVVVAHRVFLSPLEVALLRRAARRWVFDFDDAIMLRDSAAAPRFGSWQRRVRFMRMVRNADHVIAGNAYLADWARGDNPRVSVVPTVIDVDQYGGDGVIGREPIVGWMGTRINLMYLQQLAEPLARLTARHPAARVKVVSDGAIVLPKVPLIEQRWAQVDELAELHSFRVGIMPLPDDPWTRGKCAVKLLQYMAAGVPVVCSPVGANVEIVVDGVNGYLARNDDEWVARIETLLFDETLRGRFARAGKDTIAQRYSVATMLDRLVEILAGTTSDRGRSSEYSES